MNQENQIIPHIFIACDYPVVKFLQKGVVLKSAVPKAQKKFLGSPFLLAGKGKFQIQKVFPDCAGEGLAQQFKIFKDFLLRQGEKGFFEFRFFIFFPVHIAAADAGDGTAVRGIQPLDFIDFLFYHDIYFSISGLKPALCLLLLQIFLGGGKHQFNPV